MKKSFWRFPSLCGQRVQLQSKPRQLISSSASVQSLFMLQALEDEEDKFVSVLDDAEATTLDSADGLPNKRKKVFTPNTTTTATTSPMAKELTAEQKAIVKMNVTRESTDGMVKCCYCDKEITSKNVDRWASHLRGCMKTPEEVKAQIQPFRGGSTATTHVNPGATINAAATANNAGAVAVGGHPATVAHGTVAHSKFDGSTGAASALTSTPTSHLSGLPTPISSGYNEVFKVHVSTDYMKFNAAHFIAYKGFREKLHGHNYRVAVTLTGVVGHDGYVVDFGEIKKIARVICKDLNESFLVPMNSDALKISFDGTNVHILTEDMAKFSFPKADCSLLPIVHSSAEELSIYFSNQLIDAFTMVALLERGVRKIEVSISEAATQLASYERTILA